MKKIIALIIILLVGLISQAFLLYNKEKKIDELYMDNTLLENKNSGLENELKETRDSLAICIDEQEIHPQNGRYTQEQMDLMEQMIEQQNNSNPSAEAPTAEAKPL